MFGRIKELNFAPFWDTSLTACQSSGPARGRIQHFSGLYFHCLLLEASGLKPVPLATGPYCLLLPPASASASSGEDQPYTTLEYTTLHYTTLEYTALPYITLEYTALHYTTLHWSTIHYTTLHWSTLHYTTLQYIRQLFTVAPSVWDCNGARVANFGVLISDHDIEKN